MIITRVRWTAAALLLFAPAMSPAAELPEWTGRIRRDHPRLFFNTDTWPEVRGRALGAEKAWYLSTKQGVDRLMAELDLQTQVAPRELGPAAAQAAFVFLVTDDTRYRDLAERCLDASLRFYDRCYRDRKTVNWYSTSRVHAICAWDWLYSHLDEGQRADLLARLVQAIDNVLQARPAIYRENMSGYDTGFYGVRNCLWFLGCTGFGTGIETDRINRWLVWGHDENLRMLEHRQRACGDDGGGASPTLGYVFGAYPWAEQNFFYTWLSSTGEDIAPRWPQSAWLANYVIWNWIGARPGPLEFGFGDTPHTTNELPLGQMYTHLANVRHLYGRSIPEAAALARHVQDILPHRGYSSSWFVYPFLLSRLESSPAALAPERLPRARHFETMGQIFMRSGTGPDDTYCLFTCGGSLSQHRHFDALNFVVYHRGFLALDSGTRYAEVENGQHLANYYAQTVAHNCVVVHQPGEPPAGYWGGTVEGNHGGQHKQIGSVLKAFHTGDDFVYVAGDATACYRHGVARHSGQPDLGEKCTLATRQLVFLPPDRFVIFDRVVATKPEYRKEWLIHMAHEPAIRDNIIRADHRGGRMFCRTLLPADAVLTPVGGPGKEFFAAGKNWSILDGGLTEENRAMMGRWRVEVAPVGSRQQDVFLHVLQVGDHGLETMDPVELVNGDGACGVRLTRNDQTWNVTFRTRGELGGRLRRTGGKEKEWDCELANTVQPQQGVAERAKSP
jgi:heparin/heparan-sulfate lyase